MIDVSVRMGMSVAEGEILAPLLLRTPPDVTERLMDQIWLRAVFIEQRRRMQLVERDAFSARCDRVLRRLDPADHDAGAAFDDAGHPNAAAMSKTRRDLTVPDGAQSAAPPSRKEQSWE